MGILTAFLCTLFLQASLSAQTLTVYHVVGKVTQHAEGKSTPLAMNAKVTRQTEVNVPYGGKLELIDESASERITLKKPGRGTIQSLINSNDNSVAKLSGSYVAYVKKQMSNKGLTSKQRYTDFATVTRELDSVPQGNTPKKPATMRDRFNQFKQQSQQKFESFRAQCNRQYTDFVRKSWEKFEQGPIMEAPKDQRVKPMVVPDSAKTDRFLFFGRKKGKVKKETKLKESLANAKPQPQPVEPIQPVEESEEELEFCDMPFNFYGTELHVHLDESKRINLGEISPNRVADALLHFSGKTYDNLLNDCLKIRSERKLCDWAYLLMLKDLCDQFCGAGTDEAALMLGYLYYQSGYKIRFATDNKRLYLLVASDHIIYGRGPYLVQGDMYYPLEDFEGAIYICQAAFPKEQTLSLYIPQQPLLDNHKDNGRTIQSERYPDIAVNVTVNQNLLDFYESYPSSYIDDNFLTRWAMYANTPMERTVQDQIYPTLKERLKGLNELDAVNRLLNFVQTGLVYEYDDKVWGGDRAFFAEESLHYPFCDCEDRSILFTRLVRDLVGLDCALVYYPGHLAAAVKFTDAPNGVHYDTADGCTYTLCDPTYIRAYVGEEMPCFENTTVELIRLER